VEKQEVTVQRVIPELVQLRAARSGKLMEWPSRVVEVVKNATHASRFCLLMEFSPMGQISLDQAKLLIQDACYMYQVAYTEHVRTEYLSPAQRLAGWVKFDYEGDATKWQWNCGMTQDTHIDHQGLCGPGRRAGHGRHWLGLGTAQPRQDPCQGLPRQPAAQRRRPGRLRADGGRHHQRRLRRDRAWRREEAITGIVGQVATLYCLSFDSIDGAMRRAGSSAVRQIYLLERI